jgi:hypothetical protein
MATEGVAMSQAIAVRSDYTAGEVRRFAKQAKDVPQARRVGAALVLPACNSEAMQLHLNEITTRLHRAPMPFYFSIKPAGTALRNSGFRPTFPYCRCRRAHPSSTAERTSGSSCVRTGCQTGYSNRLTTSSITAATLGTHLSGNRGRSCPSPDATGRPSVSYCDDWYKTRYWP